MKLRYGFAIAGTLVLLAKTDDYAMKYNETKLQLAMARAALDKVTNEYVEYKAHANKYSSPVRTSNRVKLSSPFGYRELSNPHTGGTRTSDHMGVDIVGNWHCEIYPIAADGVVIDKWYVPNGYYKGHPLFGGYVRIRHNDGWISGYGHLSAIYVKEGDVLKNGIFYREGRPIKARGVLGRQGNTGLSTGEHLHLSIQTADGRFVDPLNYMEVGVGN